MPGLAPRYHVDVAVVGHGLASLLCAALLEARGVRVGLVGDPLSALSYHMVGFELPKRSWRGRLASGELLAAFYQELGLQLAYRRLSAAPAVHLCAAHGSWPFDANENFSSFASEHHLRVFLPKLGAAMSGAVVSNSSLALDSYLEAHRRSERDGVFDLQAIGRELFQLIKSSSVHYLQTAGMPKLSRDLRAGPIDLQDSRTGQSLKADVVLWEGDARAMRAISKDPVCRELIRTPRRRFTMALVTRGAGAPRDEEYWIAPPDAGPLIIAEAYAAADGTRSWLVSSDAPADQLQVRGRLLAAIQNEVLADDEEILLADSVFDGQPLQLLEQGSLRSIERADLRAHGLRVEAEQADPKYLIAPYARPPEQAHPSTLKDLPVHFIGPAMYPERGIDGLLRSVADVVERFAPKKKSR